jgi:NTP pyrophosphatase (non-canonical NTP hydrolase)
MILLDKKMLINYLRNLQESGYDANTIHQVLKELYDGVFDEHDPRMINKRMQIFERISIERERQNDLHEFPHHIRLAVLMEEVGEIAKELQDGTSYENITNLYIELIQTAAVCVRWIEEIGEELKQ